MIQIINGLVYGSFLYVLAVGLVLIFGLRRVTNFAHGGFFMVGAYDQADAGGFIKLNALRMRIAAGRQATGKPARRAGAKTAGAKAAAGSNGGVKSAADRDAAAKPAARKRG